MDYDSWLVKDLPEEEYEHDENDEDCVCKECVNRKMLEYEEARAEAKYEAMWEDLHCFEYINGRTQHV